MVSPVNANAGLTKNRFNMTNPDKQATAYGGLFRNNIVATLRNINQALGTDDAFGCSDYDATTAGAIPYGASILEFPSFEEAEAWYDSPEYQEAVQHLFKGADYQTFIIEGDT